MSVKDVAYSWPPSQDKKEEQKRIESDTIPPIQGVAEELLNKAMANGGPMVHPMFIPTFLPNPKVMPPWCYPIPPPHISHGHPQFQLSPLSPGGFLYEPNPNTPSSPLTEPSSPEMASYIPKETYLKPSEILANNKERTELERRSEKIEKYRNKRASRKWNRPVDPLKSERAQMRSRDENGHFIAEIDKKPFNLEQEPDQVFKEVMRQLVTSQKEAQFLQNRISEMEQELTQLRQRAKAASDSESLMINQLEAQQKINEDLQKENRLLWQTVPLSDVFSTLRPDHSYVDLSAFKSKVDFSEFDLNWTDSPHLEAARMEEDYEKRFDEMDILADLRS